MGRPKKEGPRRTVRLDPDTDAALMAETDRLCVDIGTALGLILRRHFGLDGSAGAVGAHEALQRAAAAIPHLEVAFSLLTDGKYGVGDFEDRADAIRALGAGPACEVWLAWHALRGAVELAEVRR